MNGSHNTKEHDNMIITACESAQSLGYDVVERHLGTDTGADAVFQNCLGERVILEVPTASKLKNLFEKPRIKETFVRKGKYWMPPETLGLIVVGHRIENAKSHGVKAGLPEHLFNPPTQKIFLIRDRNFDSLFPILLVSILGTRESMYARIASGRQPTTILP